jgi:putative two-component system response regulator
MQATELELNQSTFGAKILIVDDQQANINLLEGILEAAGYTELVSVTDPREVASLFVRLQPDLVLLDLMMPHLDGFQVMEQLKPFISERAYLPILVLTADVTKEAKRQALAIGAKDFLTKPFDHTEVLLRIRNLLQTRHLHMRLLDHNRILEEKVLERTSALRKRTSELEEAQVEMLERLAAAGEYRDDATGQHTRRVGDLSAHLAQALGLPDTLVEVIRRAAPLHDVGKIGTSDAILLKPGKLTPTEFEVMKRHTIIGARILSGGHSEMTQTAESIAMTHHERWDGSGYPQGLKGEAIPIAGRIVALVDVFDALTHERPYKEAWTVEEAVAEIRRQEARQFDPAVVEAFLRIHARPDITS